jgi:DNA-binding Lrp family transcriptional regulator
VEEGERQDAHSTPTGRKLAVSEAAEVLGISAEAVRSRLKRGTLRSVKEGDHVYVLLSADQAAPEHQPGADQSADRTEILERLIARLEHDLEQANERDRENRRIIAALTQRIPAIEAPASPEPPEAPERGTDEQQGRGPIPEDASPQEGTERVSWWRRVFGAE